MFLQRCILRTLFVPARLASTAATFDGSTPCKLYLLDGGPPTKFTVNRDDALQYFRQMVLIRRMESETAGLYKDKFIRGFCHLYTGQEAVCVGIKAALRDTDAVITSYRDHGWAYLMGVSVVGVLAEQAGRKTGCAMGKGGSMHMYTKNFYGGNGIVGAQVPLGAGVALALKYQNTDNVCVALYGDGASNQGQVFESYNMAKLWDLPCIFVIENNFYGMGTSVARSSANTEFYKHGAYIPGVSVDGMDVLAVREATNWVTQYVRSGKGPMVMEMVTYRYSGHSMVDPGTSYRPREEVAQVRLQHDPITHFKDRLLHAELCTTEEIIRIEEDIRKEVDEAVQKAKTDPELSLSEIYTHVYHDMPKKYKIRGCDPSSMILGTA